MVWQHIKKETGLGILRIQPFRQQYKNPHHIRRWIQHESFTLGIVSQVISSRGLYEFSLHREGRRD